MVIGYEEPSTAITPATPATPATPIKIKYEFTTEIDKAHHTNIKCVYVVYQPNGKTGTEDYALRYMVADASANLDADIKGHTAVPVKQP